MKKTVVFLSFVCLILTGLCVWQGRERAARKQQVLRAEATLQKEREIRAEQESASQYLERREREWREKVMQLSALVGSLRTSEASNHARLAQAPVASNAVQTNEASGSFGGMFGKGMGEMISKMMKDPNMREFMRAQQKAAVKKMFGPLIRDLNLPAEQQQKLMDLLLDQQMAMIEGSQGMFTEGDSDMKKMAESARERQKEHDAAVKGLLGDEKFAEFEDYKKTMGERMQLSDFQEQLQETEWPLRDEQAKQILAVIKEERDRNPPALEDANDMADALAADRIKRHLQWQEELNRKVQERLGSILNPEQLKRYVALQEQQLSMQKFGIKMAREMFGKGVGAEGVPPVVVPAEK